MGRKDQRKLLLLTLIGVLIVLVLVVIILGVTLSRKDESEPKAWDNYRLSNTTVPISYSLSMQPFIDENRFAGNVSILISVTSPTDVVYLHQKGLSIRSPTLSASNNEELGIKDSFPFEKNEYYVVQTNARLENGNYTLRLEFSGSFKDGSSQAIVGFYRSTYLDALSGETKYMATTKFEPTYARMAFPCFDEPNKKATFRITMITDSQRPVALSNMPATITTWAPSDRIDQTDFALSVALKVLDHYDDYFGMPYNQSFPKLDLVSVPDFVSGAMENWGIITFRETRMLFAEGVNSVGRQNKVAETVAHELAHMWFGNVVTMNWWDDLWLNEGFATFMAYTQGIAVFAPHWKPDSDFVVSELQRVLPLDASLTSHPIVLPVATPDQITSVFDSITYNKGSSVLRMLDDYMNRVKPDSFKNGIRVYLGIPANQLVAIASLRLTPLAAYLKKFMYKNARTNDLWDVLQETSGIEVRDIMATWTEQMGFPLLSWNKTSGLLTQTRFYSNPLDKDRGSPLSWNLPVTFHFQNGTLGSQLISSQTKSTEFMGGSNAWAKLNVGEKGYYRVNYDTPTWKALTDQLITNISSLEVGDRAQLVDDSFALASAGLLDYAIPFNLTKFLAKETEFWPPWATLSSELFYIFQMLQSEKSTLTKLKEYLSKQLTGPVFEKVIAVKDPNHNQQLLRKYITSLACKSGDPGCLELMRTKFQAWIQDPTKVPDAGIKSNVFKYGIQESGETEWQTMWERYLGAPATDKGSFRASLARSKKSNILSKYLELAWNTSSVRKQDYFGVLSAVSSNPVGTPLVYEYLKGHWTEIVARFSLNDRYLGRIVPIITSSFNTQEQLKDLQDFFAKYPEAGAGALARKQAVSAINANMVWMQNQAPKIKSWLKANNA